jgi:CRISPR-associated protein Cmr5
MSQRKKLEQGRAEDAYKCALNVKDNKKSFAEDYKQLVKKVPMLIKTNGLGATFAFLQSKGKNEDNEHTQVLKDIAKWLRQDTKNLMIYKSEDLSKDELELAKTMVQRTTEMYSSEYRTITIEVLAYLNWLKRFAEGLIEKTK